jgi:acyl carrier protein
MTHVQGGRLTPDELETLLSAGTGEVVEVGELTDGLTFDELGVDSLALLGVITVIERGREVALPDDAAQIPVVKDFLDTVNDALAKGE